MKRVAITAALLLAGAAAVAAVDVAPPKPSAETTVYHAQCSRTGTCLIAEADLKELVHDHNAQFAEIRRLEAELERRARCASDRGT